MCSHFESVASHRVLTNHFKVTESAPHSSESIKTDVWPGYATWMIRRQSQPTRVAEAAVFGLIPTWAKDRQISRYTYNARAETVMAKPSFRDAWAKHQHCIVPASAIYEPDWRSGKALAGRIEAIDQSPMALAGLWSEWRDDQGQVLLSFSLLTISAATHPLMKNFHRPQDEKRMVVILPNDRHDAWLNAHGDERLALLQPYPAELLHSHTQAQDAPPQPSLFAEP
jgi:putative SOS response-associated peptidase YedK